MRNVMILISGMPGVGKSTLAEYLSKELHIPLVSYDRLLARVMELAGENEMDRQHIRLFPYELLWFAMEELMGCTAPLLVDYIFSGSMTQRLDELVGKYRYQVIQVHLEAHPETAYRRFIERNAQSPAEKAIRPMEVSFVQFEQMTRQNWEFRYGDHRIEVDTRQFDRVSYEEIVAKIVQHAGAGT